MSNATQVSETQSVLNLITAQNALLQENRTLESQHQEVMRRIEHHKDFEDCKSSEEDGCRSCSTLHNEADDIMVKLVGISEKLDVIFEKLWQWNTSGA